MVEMKNHWMTLIVFFISICLEHFKLFIIKYILYINHITEEWYKEITRKEWKKILAEEEKMFSDESKRVNSTMDEELLGMQGSFRKLDFD